MSMRLPLACLAAALALALVGCGGDGGDGAPAEEAETAAPEAPAPAPDPGASEPAPSGDAARAERVEIADFTYQPDPVRIEEGGKVTWINRDSVPHTATALDGSFDTGNIEEGKLASETFKEPGTHPYRCSIHPSIEGTVEVVPSG